MSLIHLAAWLAAGPLSTDPAFLRQARAACSARPGDRPVVAGVRVESRHGTEGDLSHLRVTDLRSGGSMNVYYDPVSERAARARAACLGAQIVLLSAETESPPDLRWAAAVFTSDPAYVPPRDGAETRWKVRTGPRGELGAAADRMVVVTMPHEQVHDYQGRAGANTPRWFHEGHAEWVSRKVIELIAPGEESSTVRDMRRAGAKPSGSLALRGWGGMRPKREAILRQVSPEDRRRMEADPSYMPGGPFTFGPGDIISDESNTTARYQASWSIFRGLEERHGAPAVRRWVAGVTSAKGTVSGAALLDSARRVLGEELAGQLE